ncbi:VapC toxin family PIN domain ribonuclease [Candidatus Kaiserbacteria bacterium CG10_big_fil_rev_8_21_14_0_10_51_14]|uniref:VapC toxin family PIN domain ribonuclease n=1 Tax=Candidatus Kaiserbacteria bacterium CG10_big_fil_rev_8_21_14_0_10_51_14 TaxID=1974610 RepID=A0A2H0UCV7_9BACT|nr:MAG: VapC toxin family PIN domain ribonuclease [Candidatus Kaiserbacteria bacterium CG10_big_fil_rev_8_21_14_0_10_51_14]
MKEALLVIDASVMISWLIDDERNDAWAMLEIASSHRIIVPSVWILEISNTLLIAEKRKRTTPGQTDYWMEIIDGFHYTVDNGSSEISCRDMVAFSRFHELSSYDASYLSLALHSNAMLATLDEKLKQAAEKAGIHVL